MTLQWRPLTEADAAEWVRLAQAVEAADRTGENVDADDFAELAAESAVDLATGSVGVFDAGELVACGIVMTQPGAVELDRVMLEGSVHPAVRCTGLGRPLLTELERLGMARHERTHPGMPVELNVSTHQANHGKAALLAAVGFTPVRWFFDMRCELDVEPPVFPLPGDVHLVLYPADDEPVRVANNEHFAEHWGTTDWTTETWRERYTDSHSHRPDLSFLLCDDLGGIAALVLSRFHPADFDQTGVRELWIGDVGTRKSLRGKGLATALLAHTLHEARAAGFQRAGLGVDADNATGALGVYERCGFRVTERWTVFGKRA